MSYQQHPSPRTSFLLSTGFHSFGRALPTTCSRARGEWLFTYDVQMWRMGESIVGDANEAKCTTTPRATSH
jgi:hypothetical protein